MNIPSCLNIRFAVAALCLWAIPGAHGASAATASDNWPQWRGPLANGVAPDANPPVTWSETNHVKWKAAIPGEGSATPIIWNNQVFIETAIPTGKKAAVAAKTETPPAEVNSTPRRRGGRGGMGGETPTETYQFVLMSLDRQTGKVLWQKTAREEVPHEGAKPGDGNFASASPITDGNWVYADFGSRGFYAYDMQGNLKWQKDLGKMHIKMSFGEGSSAALFGNNLVITWDHEGDSFIVALDKTSGKELWRQTRDEKTSWATPLIVQHDGKTQVITDASNKIRSYDLTSGEKIWECSGMTANTIPSPVADDSMVYCMSGFKGNALLAIKLGRTGDLTGTDAIAWSHDKNTPYVPSPLLYDGKLYFFKGNNGMLSCFDVKTGKPSIDGERLNDLENVYASPAGAAGRVYLAGRNGATLVLKNSGKLDVLATNHLDDGFDASPAIAGNEIFLRGHKFLYCLSEK